MNEMWIKYLNGRRSQRKNLVFASFRVPVQINQNMNAMGVDQFRRLRTVHRTNIHKMLRIPRNTLFVMGFIAGTQTVAIDFEFVHIVQPKHTLHQMRQWMVAKVTTDIAHFQSDTLVLGAELEVGITQCDVHQGTPGVPLCDREHLSQGQGVHERVKRLDAGHRAGRMELDVEQLRELGEISRAGAPVADEHLKGIVCKEERDYERQ